MNLNRFLKHAMIIWYETMPTYLKAKRNSFAPCFIICIVTVILV